MEQSNKNFQKNPMKLYIQDIFRAKHTQSKYIYELFGLTFKNIMIQGVVTSVYNKNLSSINFELNDPTGTVQIYYNYKKNDQHVSPQNIKSLHRSFTDSNRFSDDNMDIKLKLMDEISKTKQNPFDFQEGSYLNVVGDIFIDDLRNVRMVSAFLCKKTTIEYDIVWLEELRYLYEKFYLWDKAD